MGQTPRELMNEKRGSNVVKNLEARNFEAYYCATGEEGAEKSAGADSEGASVSWGGSMTIRDLGLTKALHEGNYRVIDRDVYDSAEDNEKPVLRRLERIFT